MQYEFAVFDNILSEALQPSKQEGSLLNSRDTPKSKFDQIRSTLIEEVDQIKIRLNEQLYSLKVREEIELYIQNRQDVLETLSFRIQDHLDDNNIYTISEEYSSNDVLKLVYQHIEIILAFIEQRYTRYLNYHSSVPYVRKLMITTQIKSQLDYLNQKIINNLPADNRLLKFVQAPLFTLSRLLKVEKFSYRYLISVSFGSRRSGIFY